MLFRLVSLLPLLLLSVLLTAQDYSDTRFGKLSEGEQTALPPGKDSTASAYVLYDRLDLKFAYISGKGPTTVEEFHTRIKLLTAASFERANITLRYNRTYEDISALNAVIHLPDGERIKLANRDFVKERDGDYYTVKFTFPQVTEGAVIEYTYSRRSESILIPSRFAFQRDIPVRWAEYTAMIPEYYRYVSLGNSGRYVVDEVKTTRRPWGPVFRKAPMAHEHVAHNDIRWAMRDVPAFERQPYTNNAVDYLPRVRLQLQSVNYPGELVQPVFSDWQNTVDNLHERSDFGRAYTSRSNSKALRKTAAQHLGQAGGPKEKIDAAYAYVCQNIRWNGQTSIFGTESPDKVLEAGEGNSADLNLALLSILDEAGIPAYPLLVSLRDRGTPIEIYPILTQFDHLLVYTEVDGQPYLLDANGPGRPPGLPREAALNHRGWVADPAGPRWVDVAVPHAQQIVMANIEVREDGMPQVNVRGRLSSYFALEGRRDLSQMESPLGAPIARQVAEVFPDARVLSHDVTQGDDTWGGPLALELDMEVPISHRAEDYIYLQPVLLPLLDDELDDVEARLFPIDFSYPRQLQYIARVTVPEGYAVEEMPASIRLTNDDGSMTASYLAEDLGTGVLSIVFRVNMDRTVYPAESYPALRQMYRRIIDLQEAPIVFRRAK